MNTTWSNIVLGRDDYEVLDDPKQLEAGDDE